MPSAFLAGLVGRFGYRMFEDWAHARQIGFTRMTELATYVAFFAAPFLFCVMGVDTKRWHDNYWFTDTGKADMRRMWIRWVACFIGSIVAFAIT